MGRAFFAAAAMALCVALPAAAQDQSKEVDAARALASAGRELFEKGEYDKALQRFQGAEAIFHAPPHLLFIARSQQKLGHLTAARDVYKKLIGEKLPSSAPEVFFTMQQTG